MDTIGFFIATLHQLLGHDKAAAILGQPPYNKATCVLCLYERGEATKDEDHRAHRPRAVSRTPTPIQILCGTPTRAEIVPRPRDHGRHARFGMRVYPDRASQWYVPVCDPGDYQGRHRAIRQHAFVPRGGGEHCGCGHLEDEPLDPFTDARCGFYRKHPPTMLEDR